LPNVIDGTDDIDVINDTSGDDQIDARGEDDSVTVTQGQDSAEGGSGNDSLTVSYSGATAAVIGTDGLSFTDNGARRVDYSGFERFVVLTGSGDDQISLTAFSGNDIVVTGVGADVIATGAGNDNINAGSGNDQVDAGAGHDIVDGGAGDDTMTGGAGNDTYFVRNAGDVVVEAAGEGIDLVNAFLSGIALASNVEDLVLDFAAGAATGTGNDLDNQLDGNDFANQLFGLAGDDLLFGRDGDDRLDGGADGDSLRGGLGNDTYVVDDAGDRALEFAGQGTDTVESSIQHTLLANVENLVLTGSANINGGGNGLDNVLTGNSGRNLLNGLGGADTMNGGDGNDTYIVDNLGDQVVEASPAGGIDKVQSSVSFTLGDNIERLYLTGSGNIDAFGNALANAINGNNGANRLDGGAGVDVMRGGFGNDTYVVETPGDLTLESSASGGTDTVESAIALTLLANVENLVLTGSANINGAGNALANSLTGNSGNNLLNGLAGADVMTGGDGDDVYIADNAGDQAIETNAAGGTDRVQSSVDFSLGANVENLTLTGAANVDGTGNTLDNVINGNGGANILDGDAGDDTLRGGAGVDALHGGIGNDTLDGGSGADGFHFETALDAATNVDTITGYRVADDTIFLDDVVFTGLAPGPLTAAAFHTGSAAADADDRIIYDAATGALLYDSDGVGGADAVQFATLSPALAMSASEFTII